MLEHHTNRKTDINLSFKEEMRTALKSQAELEKFFEIKLEPSSYSIFIPRALAYRIKKSGVGSPLWNQFLPKAEEELNWGAIDPIGDMIKSKGNGLIHRYKNRVLFTPTTTCPVLCRYCFRKNELNHNKDIFNTKLKDAVEYIKTNQDINELIFTGGDPLILSNKKLNDYLEAFSQAPELKYIRFHSRTPVIIPSRIDKEFCQSLKKWKHRFKKVILIIHINHQDEISKDFEEATSLLNQYGIELLAQTVLLKDVNDNANALKKLFTSLSDLNVRPYYLHHPDQVKGAKHFYLSLERGREIFSKLRNQLSGWAIPEYVIDIPGAEGKINAFNPEGFNFSGKLINKDSQLVSYKQEAE